MTDAAARPRPQDFASGRPIVFRNATVITVDSQGVLETVDRDERRVLLFQSDWELQYTQRENPALRLLAVA